MLELTTELEAVNLILGAVGEAPVNSLDGQFVDAEMARSLLRMKLRRVQTRGWTFNTDVDVTLQPRNDGTIVLPSNTLKVRTPLANNGNDLTLRGVKLYDRKRQSYTFDSSIYPCEVITALDFMECPEPLKVFATVATGLDFQDKYQTDPTLHRFTQADMSSAWSALLDYEAEEGKYNVLTDSPTALRIKLGRYAAR